MLGLDAGAEAVGSTGLQKSLVAERARAEIDGVWTGQIVTARDVSPPGHAITVRWSPAAGATRAELQPAALRVSPWPTPQALGNLPLSQHGHRFEVTPGTEQPIRSLTLHGFEHESISLRHAGDLSSNRRLLVETFDGGRWVPRFAIPSIPRSGAMPARLEGASYANSVLSVPDVLASKFRISLVAGAREDEFSTLPSSCERVSGVATALPVDLELVAPDESVLWQRPGPFRPDSPTASVDLRHGMQIALNEALSRSEDLDITLRLRSRLPAQAGVVMPSVRGHLVRAFPDVVRQQLQGEAAPLALPAPALASEAPETAHADLRVRYAGIRLLPHLCDAAPDPSAAVSGRIVRQAAVARALPPEALAGRSVARVGLIGRAPEACELSVQLKHGLDRRPLGEPAVQQVTAGRALGVHWLAFPDGHPVESDLLVSVVATRGRFFWVGDVPRLRLAVFDPDPAGRVVRIGQHGMLSVESGDVTLPGHALPPVAFAGGPALESELFVTVELSDLTLRYRR